LKVSDLLDDISMPDGEINEEDTKLEIIIRDYEGKLHNVVGDGIMHDYNEGQLILEMHSEIEDDE